MKFLGLNKKHFVWLNLYPNEALDGKVKYLPLVCAALMILLELSALISSALFIYRNFEEDIRNSFFALFQLIAFLKIICMWIVAYNNRAKLFNIFKIFQEIYDSSDDPALISCFKGANHRCLFTTRYLVEYLTLISVATFTVTAVVILFYCYFFHGEINGDDLIAPLRFILPWDQKTLAGWIALNVYGVNNGLFYLFINGSILSFFIGICFHQEALFKYFKALVREMDEMVSGDELKIKTQIIKLFRVHKLTIDLFEETSVFFCPLMLIFLISNMIIMSTTLFALDAVLHQFDFSIGLVCLALFSCSSELFLYCYFAERNTQNYLSPSGLLFESKWRRLPIRLQKPMIMMIAVAQRPRYYHGNGLAHLNLNTFLRTLRTVISYYMAFKTLSSK